MPLSVILKGVYLPVEIPFIYFNDLSDRIWTRETLLEGEILKQVQDDKEERR
jgi:hypothetical protein